MVDAMIRRNLQIFADRARLSSVPTGKWEYRLAVYREREDYEFLSDNLVALYPQTGRTHQLRIHCASPDGLGRPIVGDELYGTKGDRLMLHATEIWFHHPVTGDPMHLVCCIPDKAPWPCS